MEDFIGGAGIEIPIRVGQSGLFEHQGQEFIAAAGLARLGFNPRFIKDKFLAWDKNPALSAKTTRFNFSQVLKKFKIIGLALIFCGIVIVGAYFFVNTRANNVSGPGDKYSFSYTLPSSVSISIAGEKGADAASGRIIKATVRDASDLGTAISLARAEAKALLGGEEALWPKPLVDFSSSQIFPLTVPFLAYSDKEVRARLSEAVGKTLKGNGFLVDEINFIKLSKGSSENNYLLEVKIRLYSNITPDILEEKNKNLPDKNKAPMLRINDIGQPLNIYSGPGSQYVVLGQAQPGGYYELLKSGQDWHEIQFNKESKGWVYAAFSTIVKD